MKAIKKFNYMVDGNIYSEIQAGEDVPEIARDYAVKNNFAEKSKPAHANKAKKAPLNKSK